jgi:signal transduction histidine kinase
LRLATGIGLVVAAVVLGVVGYELRVDNVAFAVGNAAASVAVSWAYVAAGLVAWTLRPTNRMGPLMVALGFSLLVGALQYGESEWVFTVGFLLGDLNLALFAHAVLAYPSGRLLDRAERVFVVVGYVVALGFHSVLLLVFPDPTRSPLTIDPDPELFDELRKTYTVVAYGVLAAVFVLLVVRRLVRATPRARRVLAPLWLAAVVAAFRAIAECVTTFVDVSPSTDDALFWWQFVGRIALPGALLAGVLAAQLAHAHVSDLVRELDRVPPRELRAALAKAVDDPSLEIAFWLPDRRCFADADGRPVDLPADGPRRAVTTLEESDGEPLAALVHDPSLRDNPELIEAVGAAARLALENARLQAELKAQLTRVQESRVRIVAAGDEQRRRIERDLHDGAQQRLVALALELRAAQMRLGTRLDPDTETVLEGAVGELQQAVTELRELAAGVHPAVLTEDGLEAALESLAHRTPVPVEVTTALAARPPPEIEAAAYFVACEALANAVKHAAASSVTISAVSRNGSLVIEVSDDGVGGADMRRGSGLRGLADRVEAHGGSLRVESAPGSGTRVVGELPCAS